MWGLGTTLRAIGLLRLGGMGLRLGSDGTVIGGLTCIMLFVISGVGLRWDTALAV